MNIKTRKKILASLLGIASLLGVICFPAFTFAQSTGQSSGAVKPVTNNFNEALDKSTKSIHRQVVNMGDLPTGAGKEGAVEYIIEKVQDILLPIIIMVGIAMVIFGAYKLMLTEKGEDMRTGINYIVYGILGIIIMYSALYFAEVLFFDIFDFGDTATGGFSGMVAAEKLYNLVLFPIIKFAAYLVMGILFFLMTFRIFKFATSSDPGVKKQCVGIITRTVVGILIIMGAKQIVEAVYGHQQQVLNQNADTLGNIGTAILENPNIPILYNVINWIMGLTALIVLVLIIAQTYFLLTKPDDESTIKKLKNTILYVFIGIVIIGCGYIISNVILIN